MRLKDRSVKVPGIESSTHANTETLARSRRRLRAFLPAASIFAIGVLTRIGSILISSGGVRGNYSYDASVYYTAADAFIHARLPYRDFLLLHPPGVMLALVPFAALGNATTDLTGFIAGNLSFAALGAVNSVLTYYVARRLGVSVAAAWLGGLFYAVWAGAVFVETSSRLEPLGAFAFLCGALALTSNRADRTRRNAALAGMGLALAFCVKIWWIAPLIIVAGWLWWDREQRRRLRGFLLGAVVAVALVDGPFFLMAPRAMTRMIVLDQTGREAGATLAARLLTMSTVPRAVPHIRGIAEAGICAGFVAVFVGVCALAWRLRSARLFAVLAVVHLLILLAAPAFFPTYLDFVAPPLAVAVAAAAHARVKDRSMRPLLAALVAGAVSITVAAALAHPDVTVLPFPTRQLAGAQVSDSCVTSITPLPLIELDVLSRNLDEGCRQWVDSYGRTYDVDKNNHLQRRDNRKWQADLRRYLLSGGVIVLARPDAALSMGTMRMFVHNPRLRRTYFAHVGKGRHTYSVAIYTVVRPGR